MDRYSLADGETFVKNARYSIDLFLKSPQFDEKMIGKVLEGYTENRGIFVTLEHYPTMSLRGCMGFAKPTGPISKLLVKAAVDAAVSDSRFVSISHQELSEIVVGVSILSDIVRIEATDPEARKREIKVGRDGLVIHYGFKTGLLLPVVAIEQKWNKEQFLEGLCEKADLPQGSWKRQDVTLYKFTAQLFKESSPEGEIREVHLE